MWKRWKWSCVLPLRNRGVNFGLKTGSRGTPWNSKNAGPGGSEFTKCRFWPFKWHFGVFRGGSIFDTFFDQFSWFPFYHFFHFCTFLFLSLFEFLHFLDFITFSLFVDFIDFHVFEWFFMFFNFSKGILKIRPSFDHFCPPSSTPMASTLRGSILNVKSDHSFLSLFHCFWWFLINFCHFFSFAIKNSLFLINFRHFFDINFRSILYFLVNFWSLFQILASFWPPLNPRQ